MESQEKETNELNLKFEAAIIIILGQYGQEILW